MSQSDDWAEVARNAIRGAGFDIVLLRIGGHRQIRAVIDREPPEKVAVSDLVTAARAVERGLEEQGYDPGSFDIRMESPGMDRLLTRPKDFARFVGQDVKLRLKDKLQGRKNFKGRLDASADGKIVIEVEGLGAVEVPLDAISEARLVPKF